jgi:hypothetical protein
LGCCARENKGTEENRGQERRKKIRNDEKKGNEKTRYVVQGGRLHWQRQKSC